MSIETHISALEKKHHILDEKIQKENKRPQPNTMTLQSLRKQKLHIKDQIQNFKIAKPNNS